MKLAPRLENLFGAKSVETFRPHPHLDEVPLVAPDSLEGIAEVVRFAASEHLALVPAGFGSKLGWTNAPERADFVLSTKNYAGIVSHEPDDGTIAARAGSRLSELALRARTGGHWLTPDVPRPMNATLGGVLGAGQSGFDRTRVGPLRNHVLGMKVVLADGTIAKSGGQLVKNVTGYDLHRLYAGSNGTLCVIAEAALRLFPAPDAQVWIECDTPSSTKALELAGRASSLAVRWLSLFVDRGEDRQWRVHGRLAGKREVVEWEIREASSVFVEARWRDGDKLERIANSVRDTHPAGWPQAWAHVTTRPSWLEQLATRVDETLAKSGLAPRMWLEPSSGTLDFALPQDAIVPAARAALDHGVARARTSFRNLPATGADGIATFGELGPELELMRRLRDKLDPNGVFARGRFVGGL